MQIFCVGFHPKTIKVYLYIKTIYKTYNYNISNYYLHVNIFL